MSLKSPALDPSEVPPRSSSGYPEPFRSRVLPREKRALGDALRLTKIGVNLTTLPPGKESSMRHFHTREDELVFVLEGEVVLRTDEGEQLLKAGTCAGFPAGTTNGQQLVNRGHRPARYLEISNRDPDDGAEYPDVDLAYRKGPGGGAVFIHKDGSPYRRRGARSCRRSYPHHDRRYAVPGSNRDTSKRPGSDGGRPGATMSGSRHVALLRGINVGGNNIIKMVDLQARFGEMGFTEVETYIQSGNVAFSSKPVSKAELSRTIEKALSDAFGYQSRVVLLSARDLELVVAQAPASFGKQPDRYRFEVLFVREPLTTEEALRQVTTKPGVDAVHAGEHALYFRRLIRKAAQSHLSRLVQRPMYKSLTIRNWNTTTRLLAMVST